MLAVSWEGSHTAAGPTPWVPGSVPATIPSQASTTPKQGSGGTPTTSHHPVPPKCGDAFNPNSKMHGCPIAMCSRVDLASCNESQAVFFTPGTVPPSSSPSPARTRTATTAFLPAVPSLMALRPWLPSAPGEQHVKPSSVSPPCPEKRGRRGGDAGADWLEQGRTSCPRAACTALRA